MVEWRCQDSDIPAKYMKVRTFRTKARVSKGTQEHMSAEAKRMDCKCVLTDSNDEILVQFVSHQWLCKAPTTDKQRTARTLGTQSSYISWSSLKTLQLFLANQRQYNDSPK